MIKSCGLAFLLFLITLELGEGLLCYDCYSLSNKLYNKFSKRDISVPCKDNILESNAVQCPDENSVCALLHFKLGNQEEVVRTCAKDTADICNSGVPGGLDIISCRTCSKDLCNEKDNEGPSTNGTCPTLTMDVNFNINLNVRNVQ